jgi:hypothetical protein
MRNDKAFHSPLNPQDTEKQTCRCRHTNPDICAKNRMPKVCAFVRPDKTCLSPPVSWPKQFRKHQQERAEKKVNVDESENQNLRIAPYLLPLRTMSGSLTVRTKPRI